MSSCACGCVKGGLGQHGFEGGDAGLRYRRVCICRGVISWRIREQGSHLLVTLIRGGDDIHLWIHLR